MKNIFIIPTDKPSKLHLWSDVESTRLELCDLEYSHTRNTQNIYITSDEEIKGDDWVFDSTNYGLIHKVWEVTETHFTFKDSLHARGLKSINRNLKAHFKKIVLTSDQELIEDGIQPIDDTFLEWFVKNQTFEKIVVYNDRLVGYEYDNYTIIYPEEEEGLYDDI